MGRKLYVGNLAYSVRDSDLEDLFAAHGTVDSAQVIMDRDTGRSKGFGFVEMSSDQEAQAAIALSRGQADLGFLAGREWAQAGDTGFAALQTPFLVTTVSAATAVTSSPAR